MRRAAAGHRGRVLRRPPHPRAATRGEQSAAVGDAASALVRHLHRRMRSDGLETVNVRTSRGTTVPVTTPYYREKHARRAKRRPGLYPALVVLGIYDRCELALQAARSRCSALLAEAQAQLPRASPWISRPSADRLSLLRGPELAAERGVGLLDRVTGKQVVVSLDGGRVVSLRSFSPRRRRGSPIPYRLEGTEARSPARRRRQRRPSQTWAPIIDGTSGDRRRSSPCCVVRAADWPQRR